jgi:hypothetical protein
MKMVNFIEAMFDAPTKYTSSASSPNVNSLFAGDKSVSVRCLGFV